MPAACHLAERLCRAVNCLDVVTAEGRLGVSIGLAEYRGGLSALELLEEADQALYRAKNEGKDRIETNANLLPV